MERPALKEPKVTKQPKAVKKHPQAPKKIGKRGRSKVAPKWPEMVKKRPKVLEWHQKPSKNSAIKNVACDSTTFLLNNLEGGVGHIVSNGMRTQVLGAAGWGGSVGCWNLGIYSRLKNPLISISRSFANHTGSTSSGATTVTLQAAT